MKTKHRDAAKAKRRRHDNPMDRLRLTCSRGEMTPELVDAYEPLIQRHVTASIRTIERNSEIDNAHVQRVVAKLNEIFRRMRNGGKDERDFDNLAACFNVGYMRATKIDALAEETISAGMRAMEAADVRFGQHGRYGFSGPELVQVQDAIDLYAQILALSTAAQMEEALAGAALAQAEAIAARDGITVEAAMASLEAETA